MGSETTVSYSHGTSESSSICYFRKTETLSPQASADMPALTRPIETLRSMLQSPDFNFPSDAKIVVTGNHEIPIHRRILSQRNLFFKNLFYGPFVKGNVTKFEMKELGKDFDVGFDALVFVLDYLYTGKLSPLPEGVCGCVDEECSHVGCRPVVNFMVEVLYTSFTFQIPELLALYERHLLDILENVAIDDILVILCVANTCNKVCDKLLKKCNETVVKSGIDIVTLEKVLPYDIVKQIMDLHLELGLGEFRIFSFPDKPVKRIHRALDSNDVELVRMLLKEEHTILDDAYALHYAVAYCDAETTMELLDLGHADVNHRNPRGYTVLHVAAMREEPAILVSLLIKGARPSDLTPDGKKAVQISKRFTRFVDYNKPIEEGKASPKGWLCIQILEQAERVAHDCAGSSRKQLELLLSSIPATDIANLKQQICFMDESMSNIRVLCVAAPNLKENPSSSLAFQPTHLQQISSSEQLPMSLALLERQCNPSDAASKCRGAAGQGYCSNIWQLGPGMQMLSSFVKVYKSGSMGRSIDITRYRGYDELRHNLAREFGIEGQLEDSYSSRWKLVYIDRENDILHIDGVLPWEAFVSSVWIIKILSSAELSADFPQENPSYSSEFQSTHLSQISSSVQPLLSSALLERQCNPSDAAGRGQFSKLSQPGLGMRMRTYTRVLKRGSVGKSIDITRYRGYDELRRDLARMFGIEGQLEASYCSQWRLCYIDHENDLLIVGEDPWEEFINCVRSIKILSSAEVKQFSLDGDL